MPSVWFSGVSKVVGCLSAVLMIRVFEHPSDDFPGFGDTLPRLCFLICSTERETKIVSEEIGVYVESPNAITCVLIVPELRCWRMLMNVFSSPADGCCFLRLFLISTVPLC